MSSARPDPDLHEWVSFEFDDQTWMFDVTFLASSWTCIWDRGCLGIGAEPAPEKMHGCCSYGAHFSDDADLDRVRIAAARLTAAQWEHRVPVDEAFGLDGDAAETITVDGACVFLNSPEFGGGAGCALHRGATEAGESIVGWKPEVCWQLPLRLEHHVDENGHEVSTLRQWRRHDWGEGGAGLHWWCTEDDRAFIGDGSVVERLSDEIIALVGERLYEAVVTYLQGRHSEIAVRHPALGRVAT